MKFKKAFITLAASAMSLSAFAAPVLSNGNSLLSNSGITASAASVGKVTQNDITYNLYDSVNIDGNVRYNAAYVAECKAESGCVTIPEGIYVNGSYYKVYKINYHAFYNSKISALDMHNAYSLVDISTEAFYCCNEITDVLLPPNLKAGLDLKKMFFSCSALRSFATVPCANYSMIDGVLYNKDVTELILYPRGKNDTEYTIPATVESFNKDAFYGSYSNINNINLSPDVSFENAKKQAEIFFKIVTLENRSDITFNGEPIYTKDENNETEPVINPLLRDSFYEFFPDCTIISDAYAKDYAAYVVKNIIDDNDNDYVRAIKLHDWLCDHTEYDPVISDLIDKNQDIPADHKNHCYASAFLHYEKAHGLYEHDGFYTVCDGYAMAYKLLLNAAGISCERISASPVEGKYGHAWNIVRLNDKDDDANNDKYYYIDVTWDSAGKYDNFMTFGPEGENGHSKSYEKWRLTSRDAFNILPEKTDYILKFGDADKNGYLTIDDYKKIKELAANGGYVDEADLNGDSQITDEDADIMARYILIKRGDVKSNGIIDEDDINFIKRSVLINANANLGFDVNLDGKLDSADVDMIEAMKGAKTQIINDVQLSMIKGMAYHIYPEFNIGDIDGSGNINSADAMMLNGIIAADADGRGDIYTEDQHTRADIDHDGKVTSADSNILNGYLNSAVSGDDISFCQFVIESIMNQ